mmetsp:Transcript_12500/g.19345  ORF Transcript_12500/g.19345 Transcript_12500/m.19345 type:complete len:225 (+) Transcript_12500:315-989(+)|eukprot:CAMPEP_0194217570 /NCGR_PEP_ID=MMETSP0156-20130528/21648_1 /TAXON_ID=33649 /ORGANISM="Thalassionema nitzschioides, Strain L26-B" /LENGTH=224 /DNA_ID=CAMNT_0038946655 /DNA_START=267 /DNA_END=941 /DNA_ORIENTATION=+
MYAPFRIAKDEDADDKKQSRESVARGLADGYAFNFLEFMSVHLRAVGKPIFVLLPKMPKYHDDTNNDAARNSWVRNGSVTIRDLITQMKAAQIIQTEGRSLHPSETGRPTVDSLVNGGAFIDVPTTLTVLIRGIIEDKANDDGDDFDVAWYNQEVELFRKRLTRTVKEGGYGDVVNIIELEFFNLTQTDADGNKFQLQIDFTNFNKNHGYEENKECAKYVSMNA